MQTQVKFSTKQPLTYYILTNMVTTLQILLINILSVFIDYTGIHNSLSPIETFFYDIQVSCIETVTAHLATVIQCKIFIIIIIVLLYYRIVLSTCAHNNVT